MEGCTECTGTTDEIENEVTQLQNSLETSFKNNCKERKHAARKGALWWYLEWINCVKNVITILDGHAGT